MTRLQSCTTAIKIVSICATDRSRMASLLAESLTSRGRPASASRGARLSGPPRAPPPPVSASLKAAAARATRSLALCPRPAGAETADCPRGRCADGLETRTMPIPRTSTAPLKHGVDALIVVHDSSYARHVTVRSYMCCRVSCGIWLRMPTVTHQPIHCGSCYHNR